MCPPPCDSLFCGSPDTRCERPGPSDPDHPCLTTHSSSNRRGTLVAPFSPTPEASTWTLEPVPNCEKAPPRREGRGRLYLCPFRTEGRRPRLGSGPEETTKCRGGLSSKTVSPSGPGRPPRPRREVTDGAGSGTPEATAGWSLCGAVSDTGHGTRTGVGGATSPRNPWDGVPWQGSAFPVQDQGGGQRPRPRSPF